MNKNKDIEKMELLIVNDILMERTAHETAEHLASAGYGNVVEAVKEFAKKALRLIHREFDIETDYTPSMVCEEMFNKLIKELYGE